VGDPLEVDEESLMKGRTVRVKVLCKDALKIEGSTLVYFNKQGHMITWWSEKLENMKPGKSLDTKISNFDRHKVLSDDEGEKDDSSSSHDSGFQRMAKEQKEEAKKKKRMAQSSVVSKQKPQCQMEDTEFRLSQSNPEKEEEVEAPMEFTMEDEVDYEDSLEKEKKEMEKLDAQFEEKTSKMAAAFNFQKEGAVLMEIDCRDEGTDENMANGEVENLDEGEEDVEQFKIVHHKKVPVRTMLRSSDRVGGGQKCQDLGESY
jgi:hypothetical protein